MTTNISDHYSDLRRLDTDHYIHSFNDASKTRREGARIFTDAKGVWFTDIDGSKFLDGTASLWNVNVGHGRREIIDAVYEQLKKLQYSTTFFGFNHEPGVMLAEQLSKICPKHINRFTFNCSGSEGVDTAFRMVRTYWQQRGAPDRKVVIARRFAYHGSTMAAGSLTNTGLMHRQGGIPIPDVHHIMPPYHFCFGGDMDEAEFSDFAARQLELAIQTIGPERVAAFIGEPVQGAGGVIIPPDGYWNKIEKICRTYDIPIIADEVICGFGRLGAWFGHQAYEFTPDIVVMAKGITSGYMPLGAVGYSDAFAETLFDKGGEIWHGFTNASHPASCAAALANIEIMETEGLVDRAAGAVGQSWSDRVSDLADHPVVAETRALGLLAGFELAPLRHVTKRDRYKEGDAAGLAGEIAFDEGLLIRPLRDVIALSPPLCIDDTELDELFNRLKRTFDRLQVVLREKYT